MGRSVLRRVSTRRYFTVSTSNASSGFASSTSLCFGNECCFNAFINNYLVIDKRDGGIASTWTNTDRATAPANTGGADTGADGSSASGTLTSAQFSGFSDFTLGATNALSTSNSFNPLPGELVRFEATCEARSVAVIWVTDSKKNSVSFEV